MPPCCDFVPVLATFIPMWAPILSELLLQLKSSWHISLVAGRASCPPGWSHQTRDHLVLWQVSCGGKETLGKLWELQFKCILPSASPDLWQSSSCRQQTCLVLVLSLPRPDCTVWGHWAHHRKQWGSPGGRNVMRWWWICELGRLRGATMRKVQTMSHKELPAFEVYPGHSRGALFSFLFPHS